MVVFAGTTPFHAPMYHLHAHTVAKKKATHYITGKNDAGALRVNLFNRSSIVNNTYDIGFLLFGT